MFEIPDDDDLFNEDSLKDVLVKASQVGQPVHDQVKSAGKTGEETLRSPQNKKMRIFSNGNLQKKDRTETYESLSVRQSVEIKRPPISSSGKESEHFPLAQPTQISELDVTAQPWRRSLRRFPGPAGILPPTKSMELAFIEGKTPGTALQNLLRDSFNKSVEVPSSQTDGEVFGSSAWRLLLADLDPVADDVLRKFSVRAMQHKASRKLLPKGKIPLLLGILDSLDFLGADASVVLQDPTDRMQGTIHRDAFKDFSSDLQAGAAIVLRQVSVISPSSRTHYLNITADNIVAIYPVSGKQTDAASFSSAKQLSPELMKNFVRAADIELLEAVNAAKETTLNRLRAQASAVSNSQFGIRNPGSVSNQSNPRLFGNSSLRSPRNSTPSLFSTLSIRTTALPSTHFASRFTFQAAANAVSPSRVSVSGVQTISPCANSRFATSSSCSQTHNSTLSIPQGVSVNHSKVVSSNLSFSPVCSSSTPATNHFSRDRSTGIQVPACYPASSVTPQIPSNVCSTPKPSCFSAPSTAVSSGWNSAKPEDSISSQRPQKSSWQHSVNIGQSFQQSQWAFKSRTFNQPASANTCASFSSDISKQRPPQCKESALRSKTPSATVTSENFGGDAESMSRENVSTKKASSARVASIPWDDELGDDILSQLSDDF